MRNRFFLFLGSLALTSGIAVSASAFENGNDWLRWNSDTRGAYVSGYLFGHAIGHARGFRDGCVAGQRTYLVGKAHGLPGEKCIPKHPGYSRGLEEYVRDISEYYSAYPADAYVPIFKVLDGLSDKQKLTAEQMHEYFSASSRRPQ